MCTEDEIWERNESDEYADYARELRVNKYKKDILDIVSSIEVSRIDGYELDENVKKLLYKVIEEIQRKIKERIELLELNLKV